MNQNTSTTPAQRAIDEFNKIEKKHRILGYGFIAFAMLLGLGAISLFGYTQLFENREDGPALKKVMADVRDEIRLTKELSDRLIQPIDIDRYPSTEFDK